MNSIIVKIITTIAAKIGVWVFGLLFGWIDELIFKKKVEDAIEEANESNNTSELEDAIRKL